MYLLRQIINHTLFQSHDKALDAFNSLSSSRIVLSAVAIRLKLNGSQNYPLPLRIVNSVSNDSGKFLRAAVAAVWKSIKFHESLVEFAGIKFRESPCQSFIKRKFIFSAKIPLQPKQT